MSPRHAAPLTVEHVLLALLDQKEMHGYELYQELSGMKGIAQIWNIKQALLYAILDKLEEGGLIVSRITPQESYPPRKYFRLTPPGKSALQSWIKTPVRRARDLRQEFLAKLIVARRYGITYFTELIAAQRQTCQQWFQELEAHIPPRDDTHLDEWLIYSYRKQRVESAMHWLDQLEIDAT